MDAWETLKQTTVLACPGTNSCIKPSDACFSEKHLSSEQLDRGPVTSPGKHGASHQPWEAWGQPVTTPGKHVVTLL